MEIMERRLEFIGSMRDSLMQTNQQTMEEEYFFDMDFLVKKYLKISDDDLMANSSAKAKKVASTAGEEPEDPMTGIYRSRRI
jgi:hypothetical protein